MVNLIEYQISITSIFLMHNIRKYITPGCMSYRGDVVPRDVEAALITIKEKSSLKYVDWCAGKFQVGINSQRSIVTPNGDLGKVEGTLCMLSNTTAMKGNIHRYMFA